MLLNLATSKTLILLLGVVSSALSADCPPKEDISPCICRDDEFSYVDLSLTCTDKTTSADDLEKILRKFDNKNTLAIILYQLDLGPVRSNFFEGLKVKVLELSHCKLDGVLVDAGKALIGLEDTLEELVINSTFTEDNAVSKFDLSHLRRLYYLDLCSNSIVELANDWFERGSTSLKNLILSDNGIEKLGDRAFANLVNLKTLYLNGNRFGSIRRSMLPNPGNTLDELQLKNNAFTSLPEDIFSGMPSLKYISLDMNELTQIPKETFQPIWHQLKVLDFLGNKLECDSHIEWMFETVKFVYIHGKCFSPPERKGLYLDELIERGHL